MCVCIYFSSVFCFGSLRILIALIFHNANFTPVHFYSSEQLSHFSASWRAIKGTEVVATALRKLKLYLRIEDKVQVDIKVSALPHAASLFSCAQAYQTVSHTSVLSVTSDPTSLCLSFRCIFLTMKPFLKPLYPLNTLSLCVHQLFHDTLQHLIVFACVLVFSPSFRL